MTRHRIGAALAVSMLATHATWATGAESQLLGADEVRRLIIGNTIEVQQPGGGTVRFYFDPAGQRVSQQQGREVRMPWRVLDDGSQCVQTAAGDDCARVQRNQDGSYSRVRDGNAVTHWLRVLPGRDIGPATVAGAPAAAVQAPGIYGSRTGESSYILLLVSASALEETQARAAISSAAQSVCGARAPELGRYRFESQQPLAAGTDTPAPSSFRFIQEVSCVERAAADADADAAAERGPTPQPPADTGRIEQDIQQKSQDYFRFIAAGRLDDAWAQVSGETMGVDAQTWKSGKRSFRELAGEPIRISIVKVTVYDNPAGAPEPGLYVAADYVNEFSNLPLHCGYLMWHRPAGGELRITREESGHLTAEQLKSMPEAQLPEVRRALRCVAP